MLSRKPSPAELIRWSTRLEAEKLKTRTLKQSKGYGTGIRPNASRLGHPPTHQF